MSLLDVLRLGVSIADKSTKALQTSVTYEQFVSADGYGTKQYSAAATLKAIVEFKQKQVRTSTGIIATSQALVMFLDIKALVIATEGEGIDDNDRITLPALLGRGPFTGPILNLDGFLDAGTGKPIATEVYLG